MTSASVERSVSQEDKPRGVGLKLAVILLVVGTATIILRAAPVFDPGIGELWSRLTSIAHEASRARSRPADWQKFAGPATEELKLIAREARRAHERRLGPWRWISSDRREEAALKEAQRIAESDLPALIAAGPPGSALRERNVQEALARLDDHLAGASPYTPPVRPVENQAGLEGGPARKMGLPGWLKPVIVVDLVLLVVGMIWWSRRSKRRRAAGHPAI